MRIVGFVALIACTFPAAAQLEAGVATVSITPLEKGIPTQLGGYGAREGKPAEGILDTLKGKALVLRFEGRKSAVVTMDVCSLPVCVVKEALTKAAVEGLTIDRVIFAASHTHTGLEGFALDRRNVANNPHIGLFSEPMLNFVTDRLAEALQQANAALQPVTAASGTVDLPGMNHNRRGDACVDLALTVLRLDTADGKPYVVLVNFTAHGTFVDDPDMLISAEWAGSMQRTVEDLMEGVTCMYTNGAEGDQAPSGKPAGSRYEKAENYGRRVGIAAWKLVEPLRTAPVKTFAMESREVALPAKVGHPDFIKIAGDEYKVTQDDLNAMLQVMFPEKAPLCALRIDDYMMLTFPGEPICEIGVAVKDEIRKGGITHPCVASLVDDHVGYILTPEEYRQSGYEATASFYGETLGMLMKDNALAFVRDVVKKH